MCKVETTLAMSCSIQRSVISGCDFSWRGLGTDIRYELETAARMEAQFRGDCLGAEVAAELNIVTPVRELPATACTGRRADRRACSSAAGRSARPRSSAGASTCLAHPRWLALAAGGQGCPRCRWCGAAAIKETLRRTEGLPFQAALDLITRKQLPTVRRLYESDDQLEGARAFAEKRKPVWRGR